jgi:hypothetical protein
MVTLRQVIAGGVVLAAACKPDLNQTVSIVEAPQILAVRAEPAEGKPGATIAYDALVVDSTGALLSSVDWAFCNAREPLAELGPVSPKCYQASGDWFVPFGVGTTPHGNLPVIACRQFGPEVPQSQSGQPPGRPVDPDSTGGYYQPLRVRAPSGGSEVIAIGETRLTCGLAGTPDQAMQFASHYVANTNPVVDSLSPDGGGTPFSIDDGQATNAVGLGQALVLRASWASCPKPTGGCGDQFCDLSETATSCPDDCMNLRGCSGAETYVNLDLATHNLVLQSEGMQVSWFATAGAFDNDRTGRDPNDTNDFTTNTWHTPTRAGIVRLWVVLRDNRGGAGWAQYAFDVR